MAWKRVLHYWPFVRGIHRSPVDSPHKGPFMRYFYYWPEQTIEQTVAGDLRRYETRVQ